MSDVIALPAGPKTGYSTFDFDRLSEREKQVLSLAASGFLDKEIGRELGISLNTLRTYWARIRVKAGVGPRAALAAAFVSTEVRAIAPDFHGPIGHEGWVYDVRSEQVLASDEVNLLHGLTAGQAHPRSAYSALLHPVDRERVMQALEDVAAGRVETTHFKFRLVVDKGVLTAALTLHGARDRSGRVTKVIGYRARVQDWAQAQNHADSAQRVRVGFWAKDLRAGKFLLPDEEFCRIYRVDRTSETLDRDIRERYQPEDAEVAFDFIDEAVRTGQSRGHRDYKLVFEDGSDLWVRLEFFIESDADGPLRANGTVLAFC